MINKHLASLALDEDSPFTNLCLFTLDRLPLLLLLHRNQFFSSPKTSQQSVRKTYRPLLVFYISLVQSHQYNFLFGTRETFTTVLHVELFLLKTLINFLSMVLTGVDRSFMKLVYLTSILFDLCKRLKKMYLKNRKRVIIHFLQLFLLL